jgi:hypothetical protein
MSIPVTFTKTTTFTVIDCSNCGMQFGITADMERRLRESKQTFFCPSGHPLVFNGETEARKEQRLRQAAEARENRLRDLLERERKFTQAERDRADQLDRQRAAAKGAATRLRNRAKHGVCPCCNKQFKDLRDHIAAAHPNFVPSELKD